MAPESSRDRLRVERRLIVGGLEVERAGKAGVDEEMGSDGRIIGVAKAAIAMYSW
jgi:hypothetical protein